MGHLPCRRVTNRTRPRKPRHRRTAKISCATTSGACCCVSRPGRRRSSCCATAQGTIDHPAHDLGATRPGPGPAATLCGITCTPVGGPLWRPCAGAARRQTASSRHGEARNPDLRSLRRRGLGGHDDRRGASAPSRRPQALPGLLRTPDDSGRLHGGAARLAVTFPRPRWLPADPAPLQGRAIPPPGGDQLERSPTKWLRFVATERVKTRA